MIYSLVQFTHYLLLQVRNVISPNECRDLQMCKCVVRIACILRSLTEILKYVLRFTMFTETYKCPQRSSSVYWDWQICSEICKCILTRANMSRDLQMWTNMYKWGPRFQNVSFCQCIFRLTNVSWALEIWVYIASNVCLDSKYIFGFANVKSYLHMCSEICKYCMYSDLEVVHVSSAVSECP